MATLRAVLTNRQKPHQPFVLLQSSATQSGLPILREILKNDIRKCEVLLICTLYSPGTLLEDVGASDEARQPEVLDWTSCMAGFDVDGPEKNYESRGGQVEDILVNGELAQVVQN